MLGWNWPGNVRELENFARKLLIFQDPAAAARELNERTARKSAAAAQAPAALSEEVEAGALPILEQVTKAKQQAEADAILTALNATRWNRKQASALLKIDYKALLYKMKKLGVDDKPSGSRRGFRPPRYGCRRILLTGRGVRSTEIFSQTLTLLPTQLPPQFNKSNALTVWPAEC